MAKVSGIGGLFFRSADRDRLAEWYRQNFGIGDGTTGEMWNQAAGPMVFAAFKQDSTYFRADKTFMLNFRVEDIVSLIGELEAAGITVTRVADETYGIFAHLEDPEGNPIELWQPMA